MYRPPDGGGGSNGCGGGGDGGGGNQNQPDTLEINKYWNTDNLRFTSVGQRKTVEATCYDQTGNVVRDVNVTWELELPTSQGEIPINQVFAVNAEEIPGQLSIVALQRAFELADASSNNNYVSLRIFATFEPTDGGDETLSDDFQCEYYIGPPDQGGGGGGGGNNPTLEVSTEQIDLVKTTRPNPIASQVKILIPQWLLVPAEMQLIRGNGFLPTMTTSLMRTPQSLVLTARIKSFGV